MKKSKYSKYFEKWEWGFFEGLIVGVAFIMATLNYGDIHPIFLVMLGFLTLNAILEVFQILILSGKGPLALLSALLPGSKISPKKRDSSTKPKKRKKKGPPQILLNCPECGAKAVVKQGKAWIPRHKKGCSQT